MSSLGQSHANLLARQASLNRMRAIAVAERTVLGTRLFTRLVTLLDHELSDIRNGLIAFELEMDREPSLD